jgi:hypothetical protein
MNKFDDILRKAKEQATPTEDIYKKADKTKSLTTPAKKGRGRPKMRDADKLKKRSIYMNWTDMDNLSEELGIETHILIKELLNIALRDFGKVNTAMTPVEKGIRAEMAERNK